MFTIIFKRLCIIALVLLSSKVRSSIVVHLRNGTQAGLPAVEIIFKGIKHLFKYFNNSFSFLESQNERISEPLTLEPTFNTNNVNGHLYLMNDSFSNDIVISQMQSKGALAVIEVSSSWGTHNDCFFFFIDLKIT